MGGLGVLGQALNMLADQNGARKLNLVSRFTPFFNGPVGKAVLCRTEEIRLTKKYLYLAVFVSLFAVGGSLGKVSNLPSQARHSLKFFTPPVETGTRVFDVSSRRPTSQPFLVHYYDTVRRRRCSRHHSQHPIPRQPHLALTVRITFQTN